MGGVRLLRNETNLGFVGSCNAGAAIARGEYLLFLNNDTQVMSNWLDGLLTCFAEKADCGIAGSRLVYPDGRLQEAGGLIFADGWRMDRGTLRATRRTRMALSARSRLRQRRFADDPLRRL